MAREEVVAGLASDAVSFLVVTDGVCKGLHAYKFLHFPMLLTYEPTLLTMRYAVQPDHLSVESNIPARFAQHASMWRPWTTQSHGGVLLTEDCELVGLHAHFGYSIWAAIMENFTSNVIYNHKFYNY